ncbi:MAG: ABC transporter permease [Acidobacteria bacterium]|nr:ABC transporter permease [Acidobacteriota bacterium]MCB9397927.1 ABC transporter permease [Acidobacteriota bacterium]
MIKHYLKLIWNRKRTSKWIVAEFALSFLAVCGAMTAFFHFYQLYQIPLGFEYRDKWQIRFQMPSQGSEAQIKELFRIRDDLEGFGPIQSVSVMQMLPFMNSTWSSTTTYNGKDVNAVHNFMDDKAQAILGIQLLEGRWFGPQDDGSDEYPVVIDSLLKEQLFPDGNALGQLISDPDDSMLKRVVGVMPRFRQHGELAVCRPYVIVRADPNKEAPLPSRNLVLKMDGSQTPEFEATLAKKLEAMAPSWNFNISNWIDQRENHLKPTLIPLYIMGIIISFMLLMVGLGLLGVLWQNVLQRVQEIGLRQAIGASKVDVLKQIAWEMVIKTGLGIAIGMVLALQVPLLAPLPVIRTVWVAAFVGSALVLVLLTLLCSSYPAFLASRIEPALALKDE